LVLSLRIFLWLQLSPCLKLLKLGLIPERIFLW
jgi:hypothetical protein